MSDAQDYSNAYEWLMDTAIEEFFNKYQRYPNATEELQMESRITEIDIREAVEALAQLENDGNDGGYDY